MDLIYPLYYSSTCFSPDQCISSVVSCSHKKNFFFVLTLALYFKVWICYKYKSSFKEYLHCCHLYCLMAIIWRRQWHPTPVLLPGKSHGRRSLEGCSLWGLWESDTTERLHFHFSLSCIGEGNGSPLQCSCLENPRDGGAWWAAISGVAQSQTQLKRLSSSSISARKKLLISIND